MKYFVYDHERKGTNYYEFYKGKWDGVTFWHPESISIDDNIIFKNPNFVDSIKTIVPSYDPFGETEISKEEWQEIGRQITDEKSRKLYEEATEWLNTIWDEYHCFTIIGL